MNAAVLPLVAEIAIAVLALGGGVFALLGAVGLVRWRDPLARLHGPSLVATLGLGGAVLASVLGASFLAGALRLHDLLVAVAVALTSPLSAHLLAKALIARRTVPPPEVSTDGSARTADGNDGDGRGERAPPHRA